MIEAMRAQAMAVIIGRTAPRSDTGGQAQGRGISGRSRNAAAFPIYTAARWLWIEDFNQIHRFNCPPARCAAQRRLPEHLVAKNRKTSGEILRLDARRSHLAILDVGDIR